MRVKNPVYKEPPCTRQELEDKVIFTVGDGSDQSMFYNADGTFNDKKMMQTPDAWQCGDFLPVKNSNIRDACGIPECGYMIRGDEGAIYDRAGKVIRQYYTLSALLGAGWVVD